MPTRPRRSEELLAELAAIVESSDDAIIGKTMDGIITSWNRGAQRLYGYTPEEIIGKSVVTLMPPEVADDFTNIMGLLRNGERIDHYETVRITKDGRRLNISLSISPIRGRNGDIVGAATIARDITERKRAEEALLRSEKLASAGRLAATIAHEINNPLEALSNLVFLAESEPDLPDRVRQYMELADAELRRVSEITRQTLTFYRDAGTNKEFSVRDALSGVMVLLARKSLQKQVRVRQSCPEGIRMHGSEGEIRQILTNLITNSIECVQPGGVVHVRIKALPRRRKEDCVQITVADNGPGIPRDLREHIFEPFFTTKNGSGTGLGLWVVQQIASKHGGLVRVRSKSGGNPSWTAISVFLPARLAAGASPWTDAA